MAFLRSSSPLDAVLLRGRGVRLRPPEARDFVAWSELRARSRQHLVPFEPQWSADELSRAAFRRRLRHYQHEAREQTGLALFIEREGDGALLGGATLSNIRRGVSQAATLGYWIGLPHVRQGYMRAGLAALLGYCFDDLRLHRIEAATLPLNAASLATLEGAGFRREGLARQYLKINGAWQDHILLALVEDDWRLAGGAT